MAKEILLQKAKSNEKLTQPEFWIFQIFSFKLILTISSENKNDD